jgi:hypothetical protein
MEVVKRLLDERQFQQVVEVVMPVLGDGTPAEQEALRAAAELALDQLRRQATHDELVNGLPSMNPRNRAGFPIRSPDPRKGPLFGVELGLPTGLRFEWKFAGRVVDGIGLRAGVNGVTDFNTSFMWGPDLLAYTDFRLSESWDLELGAGMVLVSGSYFTPQLGGAIQFDPPSPIQVQLGLRGTFVGYVVPDVSVGLMW